MKIAQQEHDYLGTLDAVFSQTKEGAALLAMWEKFTFYSPGINPKEPEYEIFIREGEKRFLRKILVDLQRFKLLDRDTLNIVDATQLMDEKEKDHGRDEY